MILVRQRERQVLHGNYPLPGQSSDDRPVWTNEALRVAQAIRKHQPTLRVGRPHEH